MGLEIKNLTVELRTDKHNPINVVDSLSLTVDEGEIVSLVGESGSGKSFLGLSILRLNPPRISKIISGEIKIKCKSHGNEGNAIDITKLGQEELIGVRGRLVSMIFQDPNTSLNPVMKIGEQITEAILAHKKVSKKEAKDVAVSYLDLMNIDGKSRFGSYPYELSGGMRQRVMIAMAMVLNPCFLIADEPTTALDVTTSLQVLKLIEGIREKSNIGVIFITHDLTVARSISDRTYVFYAGQVMESGNTVDLINNPAHPYSVSLIKSIPSLSADYVPKQKLFTIPGFLTKDDFSKGKCRFYSRCFKRNEDCLKDIPLFSFEGGRDVRCIKVKI
ncbi:MAG: ABC transporter ATP-binding protein [Deltaproteobacteria bacterium]|nr:ABC transporter ATP-binding protein [Deltaproteobacteria bacterium]